MLGPASIDTLKTSLRGDLLQPDDAGYEVARKVYNGMIDRRPRYIVCCSNVADVLAAVKFVGKPQLLVAVRGGGHNGAGLGTCDDAGPFSFRKELANQAENGLKGFVPCGVSLSRHAPMTQNPCMKADAHDTTASSAHRGLL